MKRKGGGKTDILQGTAGRACSPWHMPTSLHRPIKSSGAHLHVSKRRRGGTGDQRGILDRVIDHDATLFPGGAPAVLYSTAPWGPRALRAAKGDRGVFVISGFVLSHSPIYACRRGGPPRATPTAALGQRGRSFALKRVVQRFAHEVRS